MSRACSFGRLVWCGAGKPLVVQGHLLLARRHRLALRPTTALAALWPAPAPAAHRPPERVARPLLRVARPLQRVLLSPPVRKHWQMELSPNPHLKPGRLQKGASTVLPCSIGMSWKRQRVVRPLQRVARPPKRVARPPERVARPPHRFVCPTWPATGLPAPGLPACHR